MFTRRPVPFPPNCISLPQPLPSVAALVALAIAETDFMADLDHDTLDANAENSADLAAELWEEARGYPVNATVPLARIIEARHALLERGYTELLERMTLAEALAASLVESGDCDAHGNVIPYVRYRGGV